MKEYIVHHQPKGGDRGFTSIRLPSDSWAIHLAKNHPEIIDICRYDDAYKTDIYIWDADESASEN